MSADGSPMTIASAAASTRLAEIAGATNVISHPAQLTAYQIGSQMPTAAVRPGSANEVAEIVRFAVTEKLAIVPVGERTKLGMGLPPARFDLALDMTRLDRMSAYDPGDLTLSVEPGIPLARLAGILAGHRQFVPLAVPFASRATAGGTVAAGVDSALRQHYGAARDFVLGMEFVTGDGVAAKSGGRVVKNVSGYDLHKLMIGALGTLGVITRINFRTFPLPAAMLAFTAAFPTAAEAIDLRHRVAQSSLRPLTIEILSPGAVEMLSSDIAARIEARPAPVDSFPKGQWIFAASLASNEKVLNRYERELTQMAEQSMGNGAADSAIYGDVKIPDAFPRQREFAAIALESAPSAAILKLSVLPTRMKSLLAAVASAAEAAELRWAAIARGLGVIYVALLPEARDEAARRTVAEAVSKIVAGCSTMDANASIPWCPAEWKGTLPVWGLERGDFEQMLKLKKMFDPSGTLSPGRFAGGI
jgi:glycolate oxidase FAD binding subunit